MSAFCCFYLLKLLTLLYETNDANLVYSPAKLLYIGADIVTMQENA